MASWTQKKQLIAICGGAALVCALAVGGVFYAQGLIAEIETSIDGKQQSIVAAEQKIGQIPALEKEAIILRENLGEYVKILPDTKALNDFVRMINQFQNQSGIKGTGLILKKAAAPKGSERFALIEYSYEFKGTLWEFLKFVNLVENYERFVSISDFTIQSGDKGKQAETRDGDVVHSVRLTLQTYSYNGKPSGKEAVIPDYDGQVQALSEEIFKRLQLIRIEKYNQKGNQGRRDILVDPRVRGDEQLSGALPQKEQYPILQRYLSEVQGLDDMLQRMRRQDTTMFEQYSLEKRIKEGLAKVTVGVETDTSRITYGPYKAQWVKDVVQGIERVRAGIADGSRLDPKHVDPYLPQKELEQLVVDLQADCHAGQLEEAKTRYESVSNQLNVPASDPRHELAVAAKAWHVKATTALDFRSLDLRLQGVVVNRGGRSGVLLNGEVYEEGEYVSDELLIKLVEEEQVWFVFRGLTLVRTM
jgi:Tfp pilus assembly protein PilO